VLAAGYGRSTPMSFICVTSLPFVIQLRRNSRARDGARPQRTTTCSRARAVP